MTFFDWMQLVAFIGAFVIMTPILGNYIANVFTGNKTIFHPFLRWFEKLSYRIIGVNPNDEMTWKQYLKTILIFNFFGFIFLFLLLILQGVLPLNPQQFPGLNWDLAFNTAVSFVTNTNWQAYSGESTLSYFSQMVGLTTQNFLSASTGMTIIICFVRGFTLKNSDTVGNFWVDLTRALTYLFIPFSIILALFLVSQGVIQSLSPYLQLDTLENIKQVIPFGPVASQIAIKQLGTNGGGFFGVNSAHPFENPTAITNFIEMLAIMLIPAATVYAYGTMIGSKKHGWLLFGVMIFFWALGMGISLYSEHLFNDSLGVWPNLEGTETRFGVINNIIWSISTSATGNGSVNSMLSSLPPLAGGMALVDLLIGEVAFGGIGVGLTSLIIFVLLTVFLSGLMVGRTPEYQGKKIEKDDIKWIILAILIPGSLILIGTAMAAVLPEGLASIGNKGPHGFTELLYTFASAVQNNGSSFASLNANTHFYNIGLGIAMIVGRLSIIVPAIALAGLFAKKTFSAPSVGTFSTNTFLFFVLIIGVIFIEAALTFFPALALGPIVEHFLMLSGKTF